MKMGKAAGVDGLTTEHLSYCHPLKTVQLSLIFTSMVKFGYVPPDFSVGIIIPLIKNVYGNATCKDNYRGITLSPVLSKVLEIVLMLKFEENLKFSDFQFGFKPKVVCATAVYTLRSIVNYFTSNGSTLTLCALNISKAFDKVYHYALYMKLIQRKVPSISRENKLSRCIWFTVSSSTRTPN